MGADYICESTGVFTDVAGVRLISAWKPFICCTAKPLQCQAAPGFAAQILTAQTATHVSLPGPLHEHIKPACQPEIGSDIVSLC